MKQNEDVTRDILEKLSTEELLELMQAADDSVKVNWEQSNYEPNIVQERVHKSLAFIRALFSGNGVGKTTACIQEGLWTSTGTHPFRETARLPNTVIIVLDDSSKSDTVYLNEIKKKKWYDVSKLKLEKHGRAYTQEIIFPNGSNWIFMTHEMAETKWESIQCAAVIFDEPPPRHIFIALLRGMREQNMRPWIMFAGTPLGRNAAWMHREIYRPWKFGQDAEIECFFGSTDDNLMNLDPDTIKRWEKRYNKKELQTRRHGAFEFLAGRIFADFYPDVHVEEAFPWPKTWPCIIAMDPHLRKNHVAVLLGVDQNKELHVIMELETSLAGRAAARFFIEAFRDFNVKVGICDNFGSMAGTGGEDRKSFIEVYNDVAKKMHARHCMIRPTTRAEKRDEEWIEDMKDWLRVDTDPLGNQRPVFHVFDTCVKTIDNFETYVWDEHRGRNADLGEPKEEPLGTNCDYLMCVKYGIATKPDKIGSDKIFRAAPTKFRRRNQTPPKEYESYGAAFEIKKPWQKD